MTVYKIPPLKANEGHRANEWGDLASPLWKGRLRIIERSHAAALQFEDTSNGMARLACFRLSPQIYMQGNVWLSLSTHSCHITLIANSICEGRIRSCPPFCRGCPGLIAILRSKG